QPAARADLGVGDRLDRDVAADHRPDAAPGAPDAGHVPGRLLPHADGAAHGPGRLPLRPGPGRARPADPPGRRAEPLSVAVRESALPVPTAPERALTREQERFYFASQWQLVWWRLGKHRLAIVAFWFLV